MSIFISTAAIVLTPVAADDSFLKRRETFISEVAQTAITVNPEQPLYCMALPRERSGTDNVCLTRAEWDAVETAAKQNASIERRDRLIAHSQHLTGQPIAIQSNNPLSRRY